MENKTKEQVEQIRKDAIKNETSITSTVYGEAVKGGVDEEDEDDVEPIV